jgi:uncharacterized protein
MNYMVTEPPYEATRRCPYCAEEILAAAIKCKHCGSALTREMPQTEPAPKLPPPPVRMHLIYKILLVLIAALIAIAWLNSRPRGLSLLPPDNDRSSTPSPEVAPTPEVQPPQTAVPEPVAVRLPPDEAALVRIIAVSQKDASAATNDMQKGGIKHRRDADICSLTQSLSVNDWVGTLQTVDANSDGKGVLKIAIAREIAVETWNNEISDGSDNTLIEPGTPLFQAASSMKPGQVVRFSGHFLSGSEGECLKEGSITLSGKLREPEFIFQFSSISSFSLDSPSAAVPLAAMPTASASASPIVLPAPSFDCRNAHSKSEHLICADAELSALDTDLHILYVKAKGVAHDKAAFIRANRSEWQRRENACFDKPCLVDWYAQRRRQLSNVIADATVQDQESSTSASISSPAVSALQGTIPVEAAQPGPKRDKDIHTTMDSNSQLGNWEARIQARIERAWLRPPSARTGIDCIVYVTQVPGGEVVNVRLGQCNGDASVRDSIQAAVFRASPLPPPPDPELFEPNLEIQFKPVD